MVVVGGGPGGSATATFLRQRGIGCTLVEKESFPRFHVGESMTGECGATVRKLGLGAAMAERRYPVKHGVSVFAPNGRSRFFVPVRARAPGGELVDATTWQVRRATFDDLLLDHATESGTERLRGTATAPLLDADGNVRGVRVAPADGSGELDVRADVTVDATGMNTFLARTGVAGVKERGDYDRQLAIYSHFTGARRDAEQSGDTVILYQRRHHWAWLIPIDDEVTSVGVVTPSEHYRATGMTREAFLEAEMASLNPELARRTAGARRVADVHATANYSYHVRRFTGDAWLCVGDAHRFIDPIFSFGLGVALAEAEMAAGAIEAHLGGSGPPGPNPFQDYEDTCERGLDVYQLLLDGFWTNPLSFGYLLHDRHRDDVIDMFAGRVYGYERSPGYHALVAINEAAPA